LGRQGTRAIASEETTMRHALVTVHLIQEARAAADAEADERQAPRAPADAPADPDPEPRRLATLARRARALVVRPT
jgi:hypothetical protein